MDPLLCSGVMGKDLMVKGATVCMANITGTDVVKKKGLLAHAFYSFFIRRAAIAASAFAFTARRRLASITISHTIIK